MKEREHQSLCNSGVKLALQAVASMPTLVELDLTKGLARPTLIVGWRAKTIKAPFCTPEPNESKQAVIV